LKTFLANIDKRKVKVFLLFLVCSTLAWSLSQLSETYESRATFELKFRNVPDSLLLNEREPTYINPKLRTSGFQFIGFLLNSKELTVGLEDLQEANGAYFISEEKLKPQLERQFSNRISLIELDRRSYLVDVYQVFEKEVSIKPNVDLSLEPNFILKGKLQVEPNSVIVKGPASEIQTIDELVTEPVVLKNVTSNFSLNAKLLLPEAVDLTEMTIKEVRLKGEVERFSEKEFEVLVEGIHIPEGYRARIFPSSVTLVCKAGIAQLKDFSSSAFKVVADFKDKKPESNILPLEVLEYPGEVYSVRLLQNEIEFVLEKL